jgi:hypothetical protein
VGKEQKSQNAIIHTSRGASFAVATRKDQNTESSRDKKKSLGFLVAWATKFCKAEPKLSSTLIAVLFPYTRIEQ